MVNLNGFSADSTAPKHVDLQLAASAREQSSARFASGVVGAGATGRAIALQLGTPVPGMRLAGIANRTPAHAERAFREAGIRDWESVHAAADSRSEDRSRCRRHHRRSSSSDPLQRDRPDRRGHRHRGIWRSVCAGRHRSPQVRGDG